MPLTTFLNGRGPTRGLPWLALSATGHVMKRESVSDEGGGSTDTYAAQGDVRCRIDPIGGGEGEEADRISDRSTHVVTLPSGTAMTVNDDFVVDGVGRFEITAIRSRTAEMVRQIEVTDQTT